MKPDERIMSTEPENVKSDAANNTAFKTPDFSSSRLIRFPETPKKPTGGAHNGFKAVEADIQYLGSFLTECSFNNNIIDAVSQCELTHQLSVSIVSKFQLMILLRRLLMSGSFLTAFIHCRMAQKLPASITWLYTASL